MLAAEVRGRPRRLRRPLGDGDDEDDDEDNADDDDGRRQRCVPSITASLAATANSAIGHRVVIIFTGRC